MGQQVNNAQVRYQSDPIYHSAKPLQDVAQQAVWQKDHQTRVANLERQRQKQNQEQDREQEKFVMWKTKEILGNPAQNHINENQMVTAFKEAMKAKGHEDLYKTIQHIHHGKSKKNVVAKFPIQSSRGTSYLLEGADVLQFDFGGTGATELERGRLETVDVDGFRGAEVPLEDKKLTSGAGRFFRRLFSWIPGVWSTKERDGYVRKYNAVAKKNRALYERAYGKQVTLERNGKRVTYKNIRRKDVTDEKGVQKTRFNLGGPQHLLNYGDYSMENLEEYVLTLGSEWLSPKLDKLAGEIGDGEVPEGTKPIHVMLQGHSRGGVAASMAAMRLNKWIHDHFEEKIAKLVQFDITLYDPVPGKFSRTGIREVADLGSAGTMYDKNGRVTKRPEDARYRSLGGQQSSTVVYCLRTANDHFFTPQQIRGAGRVILSVRDHNTLFSHEQTNGSERHYSIHRSPFINMKKGTAYRGSGVNEMDEGFYFADDHNVLYRVDSLEEYRKIRDEILQGDAAGRQVKRQQVLDQVARIWFESHEQKEGVKDEE